MARAVLFVVDDPHLQRLIRQVMESLEEDWSAQYSRGGPEALRRLEEGSWDVLVVDIALKTHFCEELLLTARQRQPTAARIVLVGAQEQQHLLRILPLAQRILGKPCDPAELYAALQRTQSLRELLRSEPLARLIGRMQQIPTLSTLYARIVEEFYKPDYSLAKVGELVSQDLGIAARLLQVANSALIGLRRPATTPAQAVRVLGGEWTRNLVLAADLFSRYKPQDLKPFSIDALWEHSQAVAHLAARIAQREHYGERIVRDAAVAGLFHDIGQLVLVHQLPDTYRQVLDCARREQRPLAEVEQEILGATHAEVGAYLLGMWGLSDTLIEAVAWHHQPLACPGTTTDALTVVHAAEAIHNDREGQEPSLPYLERLGLEEVWPQWRQLRSTEDKQT